MNENVIVVSTIPHDYIVLLKHDQVKKILFDCVFAKIIVVTTEP